jgi:hypothetical protein
VLEARREVKGDGQVCYSGHSEHAMQLTLRSDLITDTTKTNILEDFWEQHKVHSSSPDAEVDSLLSSPVSITYKPLRTALGKPKGHSRNRSASDGTALLPPGHNLSAYHPAWSLPDLLETFGPLIFPIHRAALLRKRILIVVHAPVEETCNFGGSIFFFQIAANTITVYDLSVLSNIPLAVGDLLASTAPPQRLRPLFSIGVHDIPFLEEDLRASKVPVPLAASDDANDTEESGCGWIACTTDSILAMKSTLYDVLITMPPPFSENASEKVWPKVVSAQGVEMKATQRDLRRYKTLRRGLSQPLSPLASPQLIRRTSGGAQDSETPRATSTPALPRDSHLLDMPDTDSILEPLSWSALAYSGFMWWASAGEQRLHSEEELEADNALLSGLSTSPSRSQTPNLPSQSFASLTSEGPAKQEMAIIAYFHRLTTQILTTLSDIVDATDSSDEREDNDGLLHEEETEPAMYVSSADMVRMGLDVWSPQDHAFIEHATKDYFGRRARVEGESIDICGIRIC